MTLTDADIERIIEHAIECLPDAFRAELANVVVRIDAWPDEQVLAETGAEDCRELFGLYDGIPLTERTSDPLLEPARVYIFREPLRAAFGDDPARLESEIRQTLLHELGHHFGLTDAQMDALGIY